MVRDFNSIEEKHPESSIAIYLFSFVRNEFKFDFLCGIDCQSFIPVKVRSRKN